MKILVIGSGGREHGLCYGLAKDPSTTQLHCAPGNPGIASLATLHPVDLESPESITNLALALQVDLVVIGPEAPLVAGAGDLLRSKGVATFGPSAAAAQLEGSKAFAKEVMKVAGVATADARVCVSPAEIAAALDLFGPPYVVKDDALAAGKGVVVTTDRAIAIAHGATCDRVVIEEFLDGPEVSLFGISDGRRVLAMEPAQDFKRVGDDDAGPNTGGMGAYSPLPWAPIGIVEEVHATILVPMINEMAKRGTPFVGLLYAGLALTKNGIKVIEFNARFGDPETQVLIPRLRTPLAQLLYAAAIGDLSGVSLEFGSESAVAVVIAAAGYPSNVRVGDPITLPAKSEALIFHAGTKAVGSQLLTAAGRVLTIVGVGTSLSKAREEAYQRIRTVRIPGSHHRSDIGLKAAFEESQLLQRDGMMKP